MEGTFDQSQQKFLCASHVFFQPLTHSSHRGSHSMLSREGSRGRLQCVQGSGSYPDRGSVAYDSHQNALPTYLLRAPIATTLTLVWYCKHKRVSVRVVWYCDLSRSAAAAASTGRSVSGSSRSRPSASAASIMAACSLAAWEDCPKRKRTYFTVLHIDLERKGGTSPECPATAAARDAPRRTKPPIC